MVVGSYVEVTFLAQRYFRYGSEFVKSVNNVSQLSFVKTQADVEENVYYLI